ncbi:YmdB family metallophosphoesterase [Coprothermobacteraceae bacterium]|nr:YmdB family metallophosphoesterase [Coprothermobacteraceae bacterium]
MRILFFGDVVGEPGRKAVRILTSKWRVEYQVDLVVANGENSAGGLGINRKAVEELLDAGVDVITTGNHAFHWKEWEEVYRDYPMVLFPANYPGMLERSYYIKDGVAVVSLQGRVFMDCIDNPFPAIDRVLEELSAARWRIVDFHAEATSEKLAMAYYLDGRVDAVLGTHTHVQTADERVFPQGTLYITDVGMTGPIENSILGMDKDTVIPTFITNRPMRFRIASGPVLVNAVLVDIDRDRSITRINYVWAEG